MKKPICFLVMSSAFLVAAVTTFTPSDDVYILTFGGGEGWNTFMKFNISALPAGNTIDSVFLTVFAYQINGNWDGDANFWNVHDQAWTEATSANTLWVRPTSDSTNQSSGFCTAVGWNRSVDLKQIFQADYSTGNTFCSIKIKDPDDVTFNPPPNSWPYDRDDTLGLGNRAFGFTAFFYPHEYVNGCPVLFVFYTPGGKIEEISKVEAGSRRLGAYPNPFTTKLDIRYTTQDTRSKSHGLRVFNAAGRLVKQFNHLTNLPFNQVFWDGTDNGGEPVNPGVYFICLSSERIKVIKR